MRFIHELLKKQFLLNNNHNLTRIRICSGLAFICLASCGCQGLDGCLVRKPDSGSWTEHETGVFYFGSKTTETAPIPLKEIAVRDMRRRTKGKSDVHYPAAMKKQADDVLAVMADQETMIQELTGLAPTPFGIILYGPASSLTEYRPLVKEGWAHPHWAVPVIQNKTREKNITVSGDAMYLIAHERTELLIRESMQNRSRSDNQFIRWIADGLAEWVSDRVSCRQFPAQHLERLLSSRELLETLSVESFNLPAWRDARLGALSDSQDEIRAEMDKVHKKAAGDIYTDFANPVCYVVALCFWLDVADRHGDAVIESFVSRLHTLSDPGNQQICGLLGKVLGETVNENALNYSILRAKRVLDKRIRTLQEATGTANASPAVKSRDVF
jgi:hypothetical protein